MNTDNAARKGCDDGVNPLALSPVNERRMRSASAARNAEQVIALLDKDPNAEIPEFDLFAAMQTCAYRASRMPKSRKITPRERCRWARRWKRLRDEVIDRNLGLVYTMMTRFGATELDWDEQRSEALYALLRAVDGFDPWTGFRFSTYACNAITRALIQLSKRTIRYRARNPMEHESWHERPLRSDPWAELYADRLHRALDQNLGDLTPREAAVLGWRFPMKGGRSLTLGEVGEAIGLSKERARQIQEEALSKLRAVLDVDPALQ